MVRAGGRAGPNATLGLPLARGQLRVALIAPRCFEGKAGEEVTGHARSGRVTCSRTAFDAEPTRSCERAGRHFSRGGGAALWMKVVQQRDRRASTRVRVPKIARLGGAHQLQHGQEDLWEGVGGLNLTCRAAAGAGGADGDDEWARKNDWL